MKTSFYLSRPGMVSALGSGVAGHLQHLFDPPPQGILTFSEHWVRGRRLAFGAVNAPLRPFAEDFPEKYSGRNNRLLWDALAQIEPQIQAAVARYGAERVGVVIGTSVGSIDETLPLFEHVAAGGGWTDIPFEQQHARLSSPADFTAEAYGLRGVRYGVSTACTSGARALISAARLLHSGACDAVVCGGVDTLSKLTINGFAALDVLSGSIANPFSANRDGINIGEAAAVFVMSRENDGDSLPLLGYGASSDAHHMSSPREDGLGAAQAFQAALRCGGLSADEIGWINLHGTGTRLNDGMESLAVHQVFGSQTPVTATKPLTGHTLGAAGALEAAMLWAAVSRRDNPEGRLPPQLWDGVADPELPRLAFTDRSSRWHQGRRIAASPSFAFGGNNSVIIIGENDAALPD